MAKVIIVAALVLGIGVMTSSATTAKRAELERKKLYTACAPMDFVVEYLDPENSQRIGLTEQDIANAVESRLRGARLFAPPEKQNREQYLYVNVNIVGYAFSIEVKLIRHLDNLGYGAAGFAGVWEMGSTGTHSGSGQYILGTVSTLLDRFIASYLRVNEAHCSK